ncbi:uncharacterized [Tachysurus ichikawai]
MDTVTHLWSSGKIQVENIQLYASLVSWNWGSDEGGVEEVVEIRHTATRKRLKTDAVLNTVEFVLVCGVLSPSEHPQLHHDIQSEI